MTGVQTCALPISKTAEFKQKINDYIADELNEIESLKHKAENEVSDKIGRASCRERV